jgi:hypothetical protein
LAAYQVQNYTSFEYDSALRSQCNQIYSNCYSKLSSCLTTLKINCPSIINGLVEPLNKELLFNATVNIDGNKMGLAHVPFKFDLNLGSMAEKKVLSDNDGNFSNKVRSVLPKESLFSIRVTAILNETFATFLKQNNLLALTLCENIIITNGFNFTKKQVYVFIQTDEQSFGKPQSPKLIAPFFKEICLKQGLLITDNKSEANFIIKSMSTTTNNGESFEMRVVANNTEIQIIDKKTNQLVYSKQLLNVKGLKKDNLAANLDSYNKVIYKIRDEVQQEIWLSMGLTLSPVDEGE